MEAMRTMRKPRKVKGIRLRRSLIVAVLAVLIVALMAGTAMAADRWSDFPDSQWVEDYGVTSAQAATVAEGFEDGTFQPTLPVTHGQFAKMTVTALGIPTATPAKPTFGDVPADDYYYPWIEGGVAAGIISPGNAFYTNSASSRQEANAVLAAYLVKQELTKSGQLRGARSAYSTLDAWYAGEGAAILAAFADKAALGKTYAAGTAYLVYHQVVRGAERGGKLYLDPTVSVTRGQAVALILRAKGAASSPAFPIDLLAPDKVLINGNVITVDEDFSTAEAIAIKGGNIIAVGTTADIRRLIGGRTEVIDLKGATVLPGINDAHTHLQSLGMSRPPLYIDVAFPTVKSIVDAAKAVEARVRELQPGEWVQGGGWDEGYLDECKADPGVRHPTRWDLDDVSPDNPVALGDFSGHNLWVNSKALKLAGITKDTPDPAGGEIVRDPQTREPTGLLKENAQNLVYALIPPATHEEMLDGIGVAMDVMASLGTTSITDASVDSDLWRLYCDYYQKHANDGKWKVRVNLLLNWTGYGLTAATSDYEKALRYVGLRTGFGNPFLGIAGVKIFADGIPPSETAWMWNEYVSGHTGPGLIIDGDTHEAREAELIKMVKFLNKNRFQVGVHSTGDRSTSAVVNAIAEALEEDPWDARHYIIHADFVHPSDIPLMAKYNIGVSTQTQIMSSIIEFTEFIVGKEYSVNQWPLGSLYNGGVWVTQSSDCPVVYPDWREGVENCILRESKASGKVFGAHHSIPLQEAIRQYTINGAYQDHQEDVKGSIEVGKWADLCVIDKNILTIDPHEISDLNILVTFLGGNIVYDAR